jgi:hypothetical protein
MADRAVEEYAYSTATTTTAGASDLVSFGNGPQGVNFRAIDSATLSSSVTTYRVRFLTPILATDTIRLEYSIDNDTWIQVGSLGSLLFCGTQNNASIGMFFVRVAGSNTDIDVLFGNAGRNNGPSYGGAGGSWSGITTWKWRARKVSGGAAVGYPVSARNIVGDTSGTAVPSGYVGQVIQVTGASTTGLSGSVSNITNITLTAGSWLITAAGFIGGWGGTVLSLAVSTNSASFTGTIIGYNRIPFPANASAGIAAGILTFTVNIASNTTYYFVGDTNMTAITSGAGSLTAIRIA